MKAKNAIVELDSPAAGAEWLLGALARLVGGIEPTECDQPVGALVCERDRPKVRIAISIRLLVTAADVFARSR